MARHLFGGQIAVGIFARIDDIGVDVITVFPNATSVNILPHLYTSPDRLKKSSGIYYLTSQGRRGYRGWTREVNLRFFAAHTPFEVPVGGGDGHFTRGHDALMGAETGTTARVEKHCPRRDQIGYYPLREGSR